MNSFNAEVFEAFQNKLKVGNRRGVHLNAIPGSSRYKFDVARLATIFQSLPERFILDLLTQRTLNFKFSVHDTASSTSVKNDEENFEITENESITTSTISSETLSDREKQLQQLALSFDNLIFQNDVIKSEKGVNTLGFGFPILVRKDMNDGQITASPILIWSVNIKQSNEMNTWEISRTEDDPIYLNEVLINHLQSDSGVVLKPISAEMLEDDKIDKPELHTICTDILTQLKVNQNIDFLLNNYERILPIKTKATYNTQLENRGDAFIEKCGLFSLFEVQKQNIINDYESLKKSFTNEDFVNESFQNITSVETDPSQQNVLETLKTQSKILIQGPPGTGKSQTLTAVLLNALENKQKTIVVCEKQTALEVLYNALNKLGLGKYCMLIKDSSLDRRLVVDAVRNTIDSTDFKKTNALFDVQILKQAIDSIEVSKELINGIHNALNAKVIDDLLYTDVVAKVLHFRTTSQKVDVTDLHFEFTNEEFSQIKDVFNQAENLYKTFQPFENNFIYNNDQIIADNPLLLQQHVNDVFAVYHDKWLHINKNVGLYETYYYTKKRELFAQQFDLATKLINETEVITATIGANADEFNEEKTSGFFYKLMALFSGSKKKSLQNQKRLKEIGQQLKEISLNNHFETLNISNNLWQNKTEIIAYKEKIATTKNSFEENIKTDFTQIDFLNFFDKNITNETSNAIVADIRNLQNQIKQDAYLKDSAFGNSLNDFKNYLSNIFQQHETNQSNDSLLLGYNWYAFYEKLSSFQKKCVAKLYSHNQWQTTFLYAYFYELLVEKAANVPNFNEATYNELQLKTKDFGVLQKNFIQNYWDVSQQTSVKIFEQNNKDITVANLYNKRKSPQHNRLPLRQIAMMDTDLFTTFFPIILTTPDVCSNLFEGKNYYFDNVVFDEASQLKLEDNLPALLKGKNIIIAGDEHQMPPSNYFSKVFDGNIEDEDDLEDEEIITFKNAILNIESLLDYALEYQFDKNHLDFHYRSKHPYLIDFSNHAFYNARLKPLPSNNNEKPIEFYEVNGTFDEHINKEEADKVVEILEKIEAKSDGTYPSVGIATFNITQRNYIRRKIIQKQSEEGNSAFKEKLTALENAGLFVKNLENIQGDERDIIIISTTYGKKKDGKFLQSFGPINHTKGYKLLNVIITRAKEKIYICNSIPSEYYNSYKTALAQEGANNRRAVFYAYLAYCKAVSDENEQTRQEILNELDLYGSKKNETLEQENDTFRKEVYQFLKAKYPLETITLNYSFGGYTLDILIQSKNQKPIAIECLTKKQYQGNLAYLEDLHKAKILQNAGYEYIRIWSHLSWQENKNFSSEIDKILSKNTILK
ncbi:DUF4011 domain-containing protein [Flavobacterium sp. xlx-214]|uniref:AAA domain-containing protein n=1 Tax=unclassified Flavobacterium TaxID=196869 RepID=UPI0013D63BEF|nr:MULTISPECIES: AAA domain-containing protein [unclassified Flavobacterium]MBA5793974.1 DUF4011 domain-containing protein [Flavobacterium sp. xlx-221]QMI82657.1 DUF4011 domain-containing protein [Flavobacterium sp. xlx-214]